MTNPLEQLCDDRVMSVIERHFNPGSGSDYWLDWARRHKMDPIREIRTPDDVFERLHFVDAEDQDHYETAARQRPIECFIPKSIQDSDRWIWVSETGGTTGLPKRGNWDSKYWQFVMEFSDHFMDEYGFPRNANWMYISPTGPHTIGRMVVSYAEQRGGKCFTIDLDPRIVKTFLREGNSAAADRYIRHIWDQVAAVMNYQKIDIIYGTSRLLEMMPEYIASSVLRDVRAVLHAGTRMGRDTQRLLREDVFKNVPVVGMYGTSTTGVSFQAPSTSAQDAITYIPSSPEILIDIVDKQGNVVAYNEEGDVRMWRFSDDSLIPGFIERDRATRVRPNGVWAEKFPWDWVGDPYSPQFADLGDVEGVY